MSMGISTPTGPFRPGTSSSSLWSKARRRSSLASKAPMANSSPQAYWVSPNVLTRRKLHFLRSTLCPCTGVTVVSISSQFKQNPTYSIRPFMSQGAVHKPQWVSQSAAQTLPCYPSLNVSGHEESKTIVVLKKESEAQWAIVGKNIRADATKDCNPEVNTLWKSSVKSENSLSKVLETPKKSHLLHIPEESKVGHLETAGASINGATKKVPVLNITCDDKSATYAVATPLKKNTVERKTGSSKVQKTYMGENLKEHKEWLLETTGVSLDDATNKTPIVNTTGVDESETYIAPLPSIEHHEKLTHIYDKVFIVNNISLAKKIVGLLTTEYKDLIHACDTEVARIDVKQETPVGHGEVICFSIYSGPEVDFGDGKSCIWVDVLDGGGRELLLEFAPFFEDSSIKKVWHNYSFDSHVIENYGLKLSGFHADTMHMARLWDSSRRTEGGYSLEALTGNQNVMSGAKFSEDERQIIGKIPMKNIFGKKKLKKDGSEGKVITMAPVEELQREERTPWICYSALDSMSTLKLFESLQEKLNGMEWSFDGEAKGTLYAFYEEYWRPFGEILVQMETEGMLVDRNYLAEIQKVATLEQQIAANRFRNWASTYCPDAALMNVGSDAQLRQFFFGGTVNRRDPTDSLPETRIFKVPNVDKVIEEGRKVPKKFRNITIQSLGSSHEVKMQSEIYTATGWPSVSGDALKNLAGKVSSEYDWESDDFTFLSDDDEELRSVLERNKPMVDDSSYGTAYAAFGGGRKGKEACHAIAALCEICSIDSLLSNFILPLQSSNISGNNGRIHCSLNINTETGRLSARRPNLQNQPALEKDRYKIRQAFVAAPGNSLIVADYGQLELRILAHLANCKSMLEAFKAGGDFHSRTAMNMYPHIREAVEQKKVLLEWYPQPGEDKPPVPLLKDAFASERRKAKMLNFSIAYGKTPSGLARDWKVSVNEARKTVDLWYGDRKEVREWQQERKFEALNRQYVCTLLGRRRKFPSMEHASNFHKGHIERAAINTPVQGSAADVAMCAMIEISRNARLKELGWRLLLQVHDEVILEGPTESANEAKAIVVECMAKPFNGKNILNVELAVDAKCAQNWYAGK